jgi:ParB family chromosome partitioning protein
MQSEKKGTKRRGLGRGLDALLGPVSATPAPAQGKNRGDLRYLPVNELRRGKYQPRHDFDSRALEELANSIRVQGVVQPIVVRPIKGEPGGGQSFEIIAGERRWRAAMMAGLDSIPTVIRELSDETAVAVGLIENIQRENLNPIDQARSLRRLIDEFGMTHADTAEAVGRSRAAVTNLLRLLELPAVVRGMVEKRALEMGHARALLGLTEESKIIEAASQVAKRGHSVRETERLVKRLNHPGGGRRKATVVDDPDIQRLETDLTEKLAARVSLRHTAGGKGQLVISYNSLDELEGILKHIK